MSKLETRLKSATASRDEIVHAVHAAAVEIAKREGINVNKAEARVWAESGAHEKYEAAPLPTLKPYERKVAKITRAEAELDRLARLVMKADRALTYAVAFRTHWI
jgi:hypothetical protein